MSSRNHKEVHGNKQHVVNTAGMEQRSKFQNELTKKKQTGDYPKQPNRRLGDDGGNTLSSMGTPSATSTKDPVIDTDSEACNGIFLIMESSDLKFYQNPLGLYLKSTSVLLYQIASMNWYAAILGLPKVSA